jgi:hypothetical protein
MGIKERVSFWDIMVGVEIQKGLEDREGGVEYKIYKIYKHGCKPSYASCNNILPQPSGGM